MLPSAPRAQAIAAFIEEFQRDFNEAFRPNAGKKQTAKKRTTVVRRAPLVEKSLKPRARLSNEQLPTAPVTETMSLADNAPVMAYRAAVLDLQDAEDSYAETAGALTEMKHERSISEIHADFAGLPASQELGSPRVKALLDELATVADRQARKEVLDAELANAQDDLTKAKLAVEQAKANLLPGEEVDDETISLLHDMLGLPPA